MTCIFLSVFPLFQGTHDFPVLGFKTETQVLICTKKKKMICWQLLSESKCGQGTGGFPPFSPQKDGLSHSVKNRSSWLSPDFSLTDTCCPLRAIRGARGVGVAGGLSLSTSTFGETEDAVPCPTAPASEHQGKAHIPHHTFNSAILHREVFSLTQTGDQLLP